MKILDPGRSQYNQARKVRKTCYFCDPAVIKKQECTQFSYTHWYVLVNKYPYMDGNVMLVPKQHRTKLAALTQAEWEEFSKLIVDVQRELGELFQTSSFNIGINEGKDSGRSVKHLHWQVLPRHQKNHTVVGVMADIEVITMPPLELKKLLSKKK